MKKSLQLLSAAALTMGMAHAAPQTTTTFSASPLMPPATASMQNVRANAGADDSYIVYSKAGEPDALYSLNGMPSKCTVYLAAEMTVADQQPYVGCTITAVNVMAGSSKSNGNFPIKKVNAFVSQTLNAVPTGATEGTLADCTPYAVTSIPLDNPVEITGETPLYFGYYFTYTSLRESYFLPTDNIPVDSRNTLVAVETDSEAAPKYTNYSDQTPGSLCVSINITGDNLPENTGTMTGIDVPFYMMSDKISYDIRIKNLGANNLTSAFVKTEISNGKVYEAKVDFAQPVAPGSTQTVTISGMPNDEEGIFELTSTLLKVNDVDVSSPVSLTSSYAYYTNGYTRRPVIEEATGTWCPWCPSGIVMMETIAKSYPDWIRIAVHQGDRMAINTYQGFINDYIPGFPYAVANRVLGVYPTAVTDATYKEMDEMFDAHQAYIKVSFDDVTCSDDQKEVSISTSTEVACNVSVPHLLSFVIVEDNVGPYAQKNNYAGGGYGTMGGWENKPNPAETYFDDVARAITSYPGIQGSLPEVLEAGKTYNYDLTMSLSNVKDTWFRLIAIVTNAATGEIMNAEEKVVYKDNGTGVEDVVSDNNIEIKAGNGEIIVTGAENVAVYTLDGRRVNNVNLPAGVYLVNADGKSAKVLVK